MLAVLAIVAVFGVLIVLACAWGFADASRLLEWVEKFSGAGGYVTAIIIRIGLGVAAWLGAPASLYPLFLQVIAVLSLAAAVALLFMGIDRYRQIIGWVRGFGPSLLRTWLLFGMLFGVALIWVTGIV
jgi:hypothetical protein